MLTPLDIEKHAFGTSFRGYAKKQVDSFLNEIAADMTRLLEKNRTLESRVNELAKVQQDYRSMEDDLKNTLLTAQQLQANIQETAKKNADILIKETNMQCEHLLRETQQKVDELQQTVQKLIVKKKKITSALRLLLQEQLALLDNFDQPPQAAQPQDGEQG